jgi:diguanylate cyclase (GGDEF)-like protein
MKRSLKQFGIIMSVLFVIMAAITYFVMYAPMKRELERQTLRNFVLTAKANELSANQYIMRCLEGAESLSSRTMIKRKLLEYREELVDLNKLREYTSPLFLDGVNALQYAQLAFRVTDGQLVTPAPENVLEDLLKLSEIIETTYEIRVADDSVSIIVYSPIRHEGLLLGHDIVFFDMTEVINNVNSAGDVELSIIAQSDAAEINVGKLYALGDVTLLDYGVYTGYVNPIRGSDMFFFLKILDDTLFEAIDKLSANNLRVYFISVFLLVGMANLVTVKGAEEKVHEVDRERKHYQEKANRDALTGIYSRFFFNTWVQERAGETLSSPLTIVIIDVNDFKTINDKHGHLTGDKVLQFVAQSIQSSVRDGDLVIRYGGDEFLALLKNCNSLTGQAVVARIDSHLVTSNPFDFPVSISCGLHTIEHTRDIIHGIQQADQEMYQAKQGARARRGDAGDGSSW